MVPPGSDRVSPAPPYSGFCYASSGLRVRGFHALRPAFPGRSPVLALAISQSHNPAAALTATVWALPRSLAATCGITVVFSSCGSLDVSVPRVGPLSGAAPSARRVSPFGHPRIDGYLLLPGAFRSLSRPSSPPRATGIPRALLIDFLVSSLNCIFFVARPRLAPGLALRLIRSYFFSYMSPFPNVSNFSPAVSAAGGRRGVSPAASLSGRFC